MFPELSVSNDLKQFCQSVTYFHKAPKSWKLTVPRFSRSNMPIWKENIFSIKVWLNGIAECWSYQSSSVLFLDWTASTCHWTMLAAIHLLKCNHFDLCRLWNTQNGKKKIKVPINFTQKLMKLKLKHQNRSHQDLIWQTTTKIKFGFVFWEIAKNSLLICIVSALHLQKSQYIAQGCVSAVGGIYTMWHHNKF